MIYNATGGHNTWGTPREFLRRVLDALGHTGPIAVDLAAVAASSVGLDYYGPDHDDPERRDALASSVAWLNEGLSFLNMPYSRGCRRCPGYVWSKSCSDAGHKSTTVEDWVRKAAASVSGHWRNWTTLPRVGLEQGRMTTAPPQVGYALQILDEDGADVRPGSQYHHSTAWEREFLDEGGVLICKRVSAGPIVALPPARTDAWWIRHVMGKASRVLFVGGRLHFLEAWEEPAPPPQLSWTDDPRAAIHSRGVGDVLVDEAPREFVAAKAGAPMPTAVVEFLPPPPGAAVLGKGGAEVGVPRGHWMTQFGHIQADGSGAVVPAPVWLRTPKVTRRSEAGPK